MPTEEHTGHSNKLPQRTEERSNISKRKHMNESSYFFKNQHQSSAQVGRDWGQCELAPEGNDEGWLEIQDDDDDGRDGTCGVARTGQQRSARRLRTSWYLGPRAFRFHGRGLSAVATAACARCC